jgi:hypothetical protein
MGKPRLDKLTSTHFRCVHAHEFEAAPGRVVDVPEWPWHPFRYFCECPECGVEAEQDPRRRGLLKAHAFATGPVTPEGKAASAANLEGHPTPEEAKKTRFNAMTHGLSARVADYYPAKPGKYDRCATCIYYNQECIEDPPAHHVNPVACLSRVELFMQHRMAFETGDPKLLTMLRSDTQAGIQAILNDIILDITQRGVTLVAPQWKIKPTTGRPVIADFIDGENGERVIIHEVKAHPLLKILIEFINKNNLSLEDMGMTPKVQTDQGLMNGFIDDEKYNREGMREYQQRVLAQQETLKRLISQSYSNTGDALDGEVVGRG